MMNILIDFLSAKVKTGAGEYLRRVFFELMKVRRDDVVVYGLWDSRSGVAYEDMQPADLELDFGVRFLDCAGRNIAEIVEENHIDRFFIACGHYVGDYPGVADLKCEVICVIHDCYAEELTNDHIYDYMLFAHGEFDFRFRFKWAFLNRLRNIRSTMKLCQRVWRLRHEAGYESMLAKLRPLITLMHSNSRARLVTVSDFSKTTIVYHFGSDIGSRTDVLWSPERTAIAGAPIVDRKLAKLVDARTKYLLMVSAGREAKNPIKLKRAFERYRQFDKSINLVMVGYNGPAADGVVQLPFLSDTDLDAAFRNCYALAYPSYFEGFGYPPLEAMRYGKPVLAANVSSIPEILGDAPIYFSPFYDADMFSAMMKLAQREYSLLSARSLRRYQEVYERQEADLKKLVAMIVSC